MNHRRITLHPRGHFDFHERSLGASRECPSWPGQGKYLHPITNRELILVELDKTLQTSSARLWFLFLSFFFWIRRLWPVSRPPSEPSQRAIFKGGTIFTVYVKRSTGSIVPRSPVNRPPLRQGASRDYSVRKIFAAASLMFTLYGFLWLFPRCPLHFIAAHIVRCLLIPFNLFNARIHEPQLLHSKVQSMWIIDGRRE